jgi:nucleotide-binding universal stress UspA family protein
VSIFPTKILLATDGSKDAELATTTALDLANSTSSEVHIVLVAEEAYAYVDPSHRSAVPRGYPITDAKLEHELLISAQTSKARSPAVLCNRG